MNIRERRRKRRKELLQLLFNIVQGTCIAVSASYYYFQKFWNSPPVSILSWIYHLSLLVMVILFFAMWMTARIQLGINLTFNPKADNQLMTQGLYGIFKHPIYYFGTAAITLYIILLEKYLYLLVLLILIPFQVVRALREDMVLKSKFEEHFIRYRRNCLF